MLLARDIEGAIVNEYGDEFESVRKQWQLAHESGDDIESNKAKLLDGELWTKTMEFEMPVIDIPDVDYEQLFPDEQRAGIWFGLSWTGSGMASFKELDLNGVITIKE